ncbi:MAG: L-histidine N(alpha)-methyltransferase, partial [Pseudomonadota bacterium]
AQTVVVGGERFDFAPGETIHTENSRKFEYDALKSLCRTAGWQSVADWTDDKAYFAMGVFEAI